MTKVTVIYKKGGKRVTMAKRYADVLVKQKVADYATTEGVSADGTTYNTRQMERRAKGRGKTRPEYEEGNVYELDGVKHVYGRFGDEAGNEQLGLIAIAETPAELLADLVAEGKLTQADVDAVGGGLKPVTSEAEPVPAEAAPAPAVEGAAVDGGANTADDAKNGASTEKDGKVQANTGEAAE